MIIRSQDKRFISTDLNLEVVTSKDFTIKQVAYNDESGGEELFGDEKTESKIYTSVGLLFGKYSTEEKAIKVLDMIQEKYCMMNASNCMMTGTIRSLPEVNKTVQDNTIKAHRNLYVFEMPQDNEVE